MCVVSWTEFDIRDWRMARQMAKFKTDPDFNKLINKEFGSDWALDMEQIEKEIGNA